MLCRSWRVWSRIQYRKHHHSNDDYFYFVFGQAIPNRLEKYRRENKNIINVAYVQFDDIDSSETVNGETPMSESDAKTIVDAFMKYKDRVEQIIVHCDAGYSRSPAVAAALAKALGMSDEVYFSSGQYCPNRHVYRMMMNELAARNFFD